MRGAGPGFEMRYNRGFMADAHDSHILVERRPDGVAWVTLNRPDARNALSRQVNLDLAALAVDLGRDPDVRAVVLTGAGDKAFCAGADLKERKGVIAGQTGPYIDAISGAINAWARMPKATLAVLNGHAFGGGMELALACDFRVAVDDAQMALTEVRLGIMPGAGGTQRLPRLIGAAKAKDLVFTGRMVDAQEALAIGLVDEVVEPEEVYAAARRRVERYVHGPAYALRAAKEAIDRGLETDLETGLAIEAMQFAGVFATRDREIGMTSFVEEGPGKARFEGR